MERERGIFDPVSAYIAAVLVISLPPVQFSQIVTQIVILGYWWAVLPCPSPVSYSAFTPNTIEATKKRHTLLAGHLHIHTSKRVQSELVAL